MDKIEVSQRAREAAFDAYMTCFETVPNDLWLQALLNGKHDSDEMAHAFTRFERDILACTQQSDTPVAWMPIESAPTNWDDVVVYSPDHAGFNCGGVFSAFYDPDDSIWYAHGPSGNIRLHPTHWQPLPAAPDATNTHPPATDVAALVEALELVGKILPSAAGLDDAPDSKVIACYMNMGELRAIKATLAALKDRTHD